MVSSCFSFHLLELHEVKQLLQTNVYLASPSNKSGQRVGANYTVSEFCIITEF